MLLFVDLLCLCATVRQIRIGKNIFDVMVAGGCSGYQKCAYSTY